MSSARKTRIVVQSLLAICSPCAFALNPALDISQYAHTKWTIEDGSLKSRVQAIAQTPNGYLWLGTETGLLRFDGVRFTPWEPPKGESLPSEYIFRLLVSRDGRLWIATNKGLASWNGSSLAHYADLEGQRITSLIEDHEGTIWVGSQKPPGQLCAIRGTNVQCFRGSDDFGDTVTALYEDSSGNLWVSCRAGLWRWKPGPPKRYSAPIAQDLIRDEGGRLIIVSSQGLFQLDSERVVALPSPLPGQKIVGRTMYDSRENGLWIGTIGQGLFRIHGGRTEVLVRSDGLSGDQLDSIFEDREGDLWVATLDGLDRFRDFAIPKLSLKQGLPADAVSIQATNDGNVWLATANGLAKWNQGKLSFFTKRDGLPEGIINSQLHDRHGGLWISTQSTVGRFEQGRFIPVTDTSGANVYAIAVGPEDDVWISTRQELLHANGDGAVERTPWAKLGHNDFALGLLADRTGVWFGLLNGGVAHFKDGQVSESYAGANGLGQGLVSQLTPGDNGAIWAATEGGLSRIKDGRIATLSSKNGLPCDTVHWIIEDDDHFYWLYTACGLVRIPHAELNAWIADAKRTVQFTKFDGSDGVRLHSQRPSGYSPLVTKAADGRIWFVSGGGVSIIDPRHLTVNSIPPPVHIEQIFADHKVISDRHLPALTRDLEIDYTALSLVAPERNRFKYKLEGFDRDWQDVGSRRQAFYTNLRPQNYRFRVIASNNAGVWNEAGDSLEFSIAPAYYQTNWFRASIAALILAAAWGLYRYRVYQVAREFNVRLEERVGERTRIARDLHDTLLQSFHGLLFEFQAARNLFVRRPEDAMRTLDGAIASAEAAIVEGRDAIQNLRVGSRVQSDLAKLLKVAGKELSEGQRSNGNGGIFRLTVEGPPKSLSPILQDEIYRIGREILGNAFRHAHAEHIEVEIRYDDRMFRLRIRDDGVGIDPKVLEQGERPGHWGLPGVRERAKLVGAKLDFWSEAGAGTEVQLAVPAAVAYGEARNGSVFGLLRKTLLRKTTRSHAG